MEHAWSCKWQRPMPFVFCQGSDAETAPADTVSLAKKRSGSMWFVWDRPGFFWGMLQNFRIEIRGLGFIISMLNYWFQKLMTKNICFFEWKLIVFFLNGSLGVTLGGRSTDFCGPGVPALVNSYPPVNIIDVLFPLVWLINRRVWTTPFNGRSPGSNWWRYCTICLAIFWGYIPLHRPYIGLIYGRYLQFRFLKFPLI